MEKRIKILESNCTPEFENTINEYLKKGWKIKGNLLNNNGSLILMMIIKK